MQHYGIQIPQEHAPAMVAYGVSIQLDSTSTSKLYVSMPAGTDVDTVRVRQRAGTTDTFYPLDTQKWKPYTQSGGHAHTDYYVLALTADNSDVTLNFPIGHLYLQTADLTQVFKLDPETIEQDGASIDNALLWDGSQWSPSNNLNQDINSVQHQVNDNKDRLDEITHITTTLGAFAPATLTQSNAGFHIAHDADILNIRAQDFGLPNINYSGGSFVEGVAISIPKGTRTNRVRLALRSGGTTTRYPSSGSSTRWVSFSPSSARTTRDYYYVSEQDNTNPEIFTFIAGDELYMEIAPENHAYGVELEAVTLKYWQDDTVNPSATPSDAGEETAYIQGGLVPVRFNRFTGTRYLHFEVNGAYTIDLITINNNTNAIEQFTEVEDGNLLRFNSSVIATPGRIDLFVRVVPNDS